MLMVWLEKVRAIYWSCSSGLLQPNPRCCWSLEMCLWDWGNLLSSTAKLKATPLLLWSGAESRGRCPMAGKLLGKQFHTFALKIPTESPFLLGRPGKEENQIHVVDMISRHIKIDICFKVYLKSICVCVYTQISCEPRPDSADPLRDGAGCWNVHVYSLQWRRPGQRLRSAVGPRLVNRNFKMINPDEWMAVALVGVSLEVNLFIGFSVTHLRLSVLARKRK